MNTTTTEAQPVSKANPAHARLKFIRANTCYGSLRSVIQVFFVLSLIGAGAEIFSGVFTLSHSDSSELSWKISAFVIGLGIVAIILSVAARQAAFVLIDIADTLLYEHAK